MHQGHERVRFVAGIDEAGYGPLIGPLVVSACLIDCEEPVDLEGRELWRRLSRQVVKPKGPRPTTAKSSGKRPLLGRRRGLRRDHRLEIGDSKLVYSPNRGHWHLERSVLALVGWAQQREVHSVHELLSFLVSRDALAFDDPWQRAGWGRFPLSDATELPHAALLAPGYAPGLLTSRVISAAEFNEGCAAAGNKANLALSLVMDLLSQVRRAAGDEPLGVVVDRQSNRKDYGPALRAQFPNHRVHVEVETQTLSRYVVEDHTSWMRVDFRVAGDTRSFVVAAASLVSKYLREICMARLNGFFTRHQEDLRPTAGYYGDGRRFLNETAALRRSLGIDDRRFVRVR